MAAGATGTTLSLLPLPRTKTCLRSKLMQFSGKETSSETRRPLAYISSSMAVICLPFGPEHSFAAAINRLISSSDRNLGRGFSCFGVRTSTAGLSLMSFSVYRNLKNSRTAESFRTTVFGDRPSGRDIEQNRQRHRG